MSVGFAVLDRGCHRAGLSGCQVDDVDLATLDRYRDLLSILHRVARLLQANVLHGAADADALVRQMVASGADETFSFELPPNGSVHPTRLARR
jgi:hypothetical protein